MLLNDAFAAVFSLFSEFNETLTCDSDSITNAVKASGGLRERLFNAAFNAKKQAIMKGMMTATDSN